MIPIAKPHLDNKEIQAVSKVLKSGFLTQGKIVEEFEREFANYIGVKYAIATNSGTSALHTSLAALNIKKGDEVITSDFSFISSASSILMQGGKPVFCDIDPKTFNISADTIFEKINKKTKAILPVHLFGQPCNMKKINNIANDFNLPVIEDSCQAHGADFNKKKAGSLGKVGIFSFYPTKNMTTGEGGIITTNCKKIAEKAKIIRNHGQIKQYLHDFLGYNYRMTDLSAAIGLIQLKKLKGFNIKRQNNARYLSRNLKNLDGIITPFISENSNHVFHQYTIRITSEFINSRDKVHKLLNNFGVGTGIYYPMPIHKQLIFKRLKYIDHLPIVEKISKEVLSLPVHPFLTKNDLIKIIESVDKCREVIA